jgi:C-terminal processing protease CtpA/Prc
MTALALIGRSGVRTFGAPSAGFTTANVPYPLTDGAFLVITETTVRDRSGKDYKGPIIPDEQVAILDAERAASEWLSRSC